MSGTLCVWFSSAGGGNEAAPAMRTQAEEVHCLPSPDPAEGATEICTHFCWSPHLQSYPSCTAEKRGPCSRLLGTDSVNILPAQCVTCTPRFRGGSHSLLPLSNLWLGAPLDAEVLTFRKAQVTPKQQPGISSLEYTEYFHFLRNCWPFDTREPELPLFTLERLHRRSIYEHPACY